MLVQPPLQILKRKVLSTIAERESAVKRAKKKARRSLGRRVSFAPDAELETRHLYEKVSPPCPPTPAGAPSLPQHEPTHTTCPSQSAADGAAATLWLHPALSPRRSLLIHSATQDEYAGGTSLEALEALIRARMETNPSLGGGGDLVNTGVHGLPALAADPVIMVPLENAPPGVSAAAARGVSPQRLWMDLASPSGPVPMSLAGEPSVEAACDIHCDVRSALTRAAFAVQDDACMRAGVRCLMLLSTRRQLRTAWTLQAPCRLRYHGFA